VPQGPSHKDNPVAGMSICIYLFLYIYINNIYILVIIHWKACLSVYICFYIYTNMFIYVLISIY
jgi:hypothetical protein